MKIVKTPWINEFLDLVSNSNHSIKITSPFIKENICDDILLKKKDSSNLEIITSFKLMNIHSGSLDLNGLEKIINKNGVIKNFSKLHSKVYLFDEKKVIITSGNLTNGGLRKNFEYGLFSDNKDIVSKVVNDFNLLASNEQTGKIKLSDIIKVREILSKIPKRESIKFPEVETPEENNDIINIDNEIIETSLSGWKLEVYKCADAIPKQIFTLKEINEFESRLKSIYPENKHVTDKIRQQLQYLRDLGLIEFLGNGEYKKLWN